MKPVVEKGLDLEKPPISNQEAYMSYEQSLLTYIEMKGVIDTAFGDGIIRERLRIAKAFKESGVAIPIIIKATGLTEREIEGL